MIEQVIRRFALLLMLLTCESSMRADERPAARALPVYKIHRAGTPIAIDGRLDEPAWVAAPDIGPFHFPWYKEGAREQTVAKLLWNDKSLYIAHICEDAHITARHTDHDDPIPEDDCFEVMIAPNAARPTFYYNVEWNLLGGYVDGHRPDGPAGPRPAWDVRGLRVAGSHVGALNDDGGRDDYWICEVQIPLENFAADMPYMPPRPGDQWRLNFNRHGGETNMQYSQWAPADAPEPSFHTPLAFGRVIFTAKTSPFDAEPRESQPAGESPAP